MTTSLPHSAVLDTSSFMGQMAARYRERMSMAFAVSSTPNHEAYSKKFIDGMEETNSGRNDQTATDNRDDKGVAPHEGNSETKISRSMSDLNRNSYSLKPSMKELIKKFEKRSLTSNQLKENDSGIAERMSSMDFCRGACEVGKFNQPESEEGKTEPQCAYDSFLESVTEMNDFCPVPQSSSIRGISGECENLTDRVTRSRARSPSGDSKARGDKTFSQFQSFEDVKLSPAKAHVGRNCMTQEGEGTMHTSELDKMLESILPEEGWASPLQLTMSGVESKTPSPLRTNLRNIAIRGKLSSGNDSKFVVHKKEWGRRYSSRGTSNSILNSPHSVHENQSKTKSDSGRSVVTTPSNTLQRAEIRRALNQQDARPEEGVKSHSKSDTRSNAMERYRNFLKHATPPLPTPGPEANAMVGKGSSRPPTPRKPLNVNKRKISQIKKTVPNAAKATGCAAVTNRLKPLSSKEDQNGERKGKAAINKIKSKISTNAKSVDSTLKTVPKRQLERRKSTKSKGVTGIREPKTDLSCGDTGVALSNASSANYVPISSDITATIESRRKQTGRCVTRPAASKLPTKILNEKRCPDKPQKAVNSKYQESPSNRLSPTRELRDFFIRTDDNQRYPSASVSNNILAHDNRPHSSLKNDYRRIPRAQKPNKNSEEKIDHRAKSSPARLSHRACKRNLPSPRDIRQKLFHKEERDMSDTEDKLLTEGELADNDLIPCHAEEKQFKSSSLNRFGFREKLSPVSTVIKCPSTRSHSLESDCFEERDYHPYSSQGWGYSNGSPGMISLPPETLPDKYKEEEDEEYGENTVSSAALDDVVSKRFTNRDASHVTTSVKQQTKKKALNTNSNLVPEAISSVSTYEDGDKTRTEDKFMFAHREDLGDGGVSRRTSPEKGHLSHLCPSEKGSPARKARRDSKDVLQENRGLGTYSSFSKDWAKDFKGSRSTDGTDDRNSISGSHNCDAMGKQLDWSDDDDGRATGISSPLRKNRHLERKKKSKRKRRQEESLDRLQPSPYVNSSKLLDTKNSKERKLDRLSRAVKPFESAKSQEVSRFQEPLKYCDSTMLIDRQRYHDQSKNQEHLLRSDQSKTQEYLLRSDQSKTQDHLLRSDQSKIHDHVLRSDQSKTQDHLLRSDQSKIQEHLLRSELFKTQEHLSRSDQSKTQLYFHRNEQSKRLSEPSKMEITTHSFYYGAPQHQLPFYKPVPPVCTEPTERWKMRSYIPVRSDAEVKMSRRDRCYALQQRRRWIEAYAFPESPCRIPITENFRKCMVSASIEEYESHSWFLNSDKLNSLSCEDNSYMSNMDTGPLLDMTLTAVYHVRLVPLLVVPTSDGQVTDERADGGKECRVVVHPAASSAASTGEYLERQPVSVSGAFGGTCRVQRPRDRMVMSVQGERGPPQCFTIQAKDWSRALAYCGGIASQCIVASVCFIFHKRIRDEPQWRKRHSDNCRQMSIKEMKSVAFRVLNAFVLVHFAYTRTTALIIHIVYTATVLVANKCIYMLKAQALDKSEVYNCKHFLTSRVREDEEWYYDRCCNSNNNASHKYSAPPKPRRYQKTKSRNSVSTKLFSRSKTCGMRATFTRRNQRRRAKMKASALNCTTVLSFLESLMKLQSRVRFGRGWSCESQREFLDTALVFEKNNNSRKTGEADQRLWHYSDNSQCSSKEFKSVIDYTGTHGTTFEKVNDISNLQARRKSRSQRPKPWKMHVAGDTSKGNKPPSLENKTLPATQTFDLGKKVCKPLLGLSYGKKTQDDLRCDKSVTSELEIAPTLKALELRDSSTNKATAHDCFVVRSAGIDRDNVLSTKITESGIPSSVKPPFNDDDVRALNQQDLKSNENFSFTERSFFDVDHEQSKREEKIHNKRVSMNHLLKHSDSLTFAYSERLKNLTRKLEETETCWTSPTFNEDTTITKERKQLRPAKGYCSPKVSAELQKKVKALVDSYKEFLNQNQFAEAVLPTNNNKNIRTDKESYQKFSGFTPLSLNFHLVDNGSMPPPALNYDVVNVRNGAKVGDGQGCFQFFKDKQTDSFGPNASHRRIIQRENAFSRDPHCPILTHIPISSHCDVNPMKDLKKACGKYPFPAWTGEAQKSAGKMLNVQKCNVMQQTNLAEGSYHQNIASTSGHVSASHRHSQSAFLANESSEYHIHQLTKGSNAAHDKHAQDCVEGTKAVASELRDASVCTTHKKESQFDPLKGKMQVFSLKNGMETLGDKHPEKPMHSENAPSHDGTSVYNMKKSAFAAGKGKIAANRTPRLKCKFYRRKSAVKSPRTKATVAPARCSPYKNFPCQVSDAQKVSPATERQRSMSRSIQTPDKVGPFARDIGNLSWSCTSQAAYNFKENVTHVTKADNSKNATKTKGPFSFVSNEAVGCQPISEGKMANHIVQSVHSNSNANVQKKKTNTPRRSKIPMRQSSLKSGCTAVVGLRTQLPGKPLSNRAAPNSSQTLAYNSNSNPPQRDSRFLVNTLDRTRDAERKTLLNTTLENEDTVQKKMSGSVKQVAYECLNKSMHVDDPVHDTTTNLDSKRGFGTFFDVKTGNRSTETKKPRPQPSGVRPTAKSSQNTASGAKTSRRAETQTCIPQVKFLTDKIQLDKTCRGGISNARSGGQMLVTFKSPAKQCDQVLRPKCETTDCTSSELGSWRSSDSSSPRYTSTTMSSDVSLECNNNIFSSPAAKVSVDFASALNSKKKMAKSICIHSSETSSWNDTTWKPPSVMAKYLRRKSRRSRNVSHRRRCQVSTSSSENRCPMFSAGSNVFDSLRCPHGSDENVSSLSTMRSIPELPYNYPSSNELISVEHEDTVDQPRKLQFTSVRCLGKTDYNFSNRQLFRTSSEPNITTSSMSKTFTRTTKSFTVILSHSTWDEETNSAHFSSFVSSSKETYTTCHTKDIKRNPMSSENTTSKNKKQTLAHNNGDTQRRTKQSFNHSQNKHSNRRGKSKRNAITYSPRSAAVVKKSRAFNCKKFTMTKQKNPLIFNEKTADYNERQKSHDRSTKEARSADKDRTIAKFNETNKDSPRAFTRFASILNFWENREGFGITNAIQKMFGFRESGGKATCKSKEYESDVTTFHSINEAKLADRLHVDELLSKESEINVFSSARKNEFNLSPTRTDHLNSANRKSKEAKRREVNAASGGTRFTKASRNGAVNSSGTIMLSRARSGLAKTVSDLGTETQLCGITNDVLQMTGRRKPEVEAEGFKCSSPPYENSVKHKASSRFFHRSQEPKLVVKDCKDGSLFKVSALACKERKFNTMETVEEKNESVGDTLVENQSQGIEEGSDRRNSNVVDKPSKYFVNKDLGKGSILDDQSKNENSSQEKVNSIHNRQTYQALDTIGLRDSYNCLEASSIHYGVMSKKSSDAENVLDAYHRDMEHESRAVQNVAADWAKTNGGNSASSYGGKNKLAIESQSRDWYFSKLEKHCRKLKETMGKKSHRSKNRKHSISKKSKCKKSQVNLHERIAYCQSPPIYTLESSQCRLDSTERREKPMDMGDCIYSTEQTSCPNSDVRLDECHQQSLPPKAGESGLNDFMRLTAALQEVKRKSTPTPVSERRKPPVHNASVLTPVPNKVSNSLGAAPDDTQEAASYPEPCTKSRDRDTVKHDQRASNVRRNRQRSNYALTKPRSASESKDFVNDAEELRKDADLLKIIQRLTKHAHLKSPRKQLPRPKLSVDTRAPWDNKGLCNVSELPFYAAGASTATSNIKRDCQPVIQTPAQILRSLRAKELGCLFDSMEPPQQQPPRQRAKTTQAFNTLPNKRFDQVTETTSSRERDYNLSEDMNAMKSSSDDVFNEPGQYFQRNTQLQEMSNKIDFGIKYSDNKYEQFFKQERHPATLLTGRHSSRGGSPVILTSLRTLENYTPRCTPSHHSLKVDTFLPKYFSRETSCNELLKPPTRKPTKSEAISVVSTQTECVTGDCKATQVIDTCSELCTKEQTTYETSGALTDSVSKDCKILDVQCQCPSVDALITDHSPSLALSDKGEADFVDRSCQCTNVDGESNKHAQRSPVCVQDKIVGTSPKDKADDDDVSNNVLVKDLYVLLLQNYMSKEDSATALVDSKGKEMHVRLNMQGRECSQSLKDVLTFFECSLKRDDVALIQRKVEALEKSVDHHRVGSLCADHGDTKERAAHSPVLSSLSKKELKSPFDINELSAKVKNLDVHKQASSVNRERRCTEENGEHPQALPLQDDKAGHTVKDIDSIMGPREIKALADVLEKIYFGKRDPKQNYEEFVENTLQRLRAVLGQSNMSLGETSPLIEKKTRSHLVTPGECPLSPKETLSVARLSYKDAEKTGKKESYQSEEQSSESTSLAVDVKHLIETTGRAVNNLQQHLIESIAPENSKQLKNAIESPASALYSGQQQVIESTGQAINKQHLHSIESTGLAVKRQHQHFIESTAPAVEKQHQYLLESTIPAVNKQYHYLIESTAPAVDKQHQYLIESTIPAVDKQHQYLSESTAPAVDKQQQYLVESTAPAVDKQHQYLIKSTAPAVDKHHQYLIESTAPAVNKQHQYLLESTAPAMNNQHQYFIESTAPVVDKQHQYLIESTAPAVNKQHQYLIESTAPAVNKQHQYLLESTAPAVNNQYQYLIESTAPAVNKQHQYLRESTAPAVNNQYQYLMETTAPAVNKQHQYLIESTAPAVNKQHDQEKPTIYLHYGKSNIRKVRNGIYQPRLKVGLSPTSFVVDTLLSAKKASYQRHIDRCSLHSPRPLLRYFQSFSESMSDSARKSIKSETALSIESKAFPADDLEVDVEYVISTGLDYNSDSSSKSTEPSKGNDDRLHMTLRCGTCLHSTGDVSSQCSGNCRHKCITGMRCMRSCEHGALKRSDGALHLATVGKLAAHGHVKKRHTGVHETWDITGLAGQSDKNHITRHMGENKFDKTHFDKRRNSNMCTLPPSSKRPHKSVKDNCAHLTGDNSEIRDVVFATKASDVDSCQTLPNDMEPSSDVNIARPENESIGNETTKSFLTEVERIQYYIKPCNDGGSSNQYYIKEGKRFFMTSTSISSDPMTPAARENPHDQQRSFENELSGQERKRKRRSQYTSSHMMPVVGGSPSFVIHCSKTCLSTTEDAFDNCYQLQEEHEETIVAKQTVTNLETSVYSPGLALGEFIQKKTNNRFVSRVKRSKTMVEPRVYEDPCTCIPDHNIRSDEIIVSHQTKTRGQAQRKSYSRPHRDNALLCEPGANKHLHKCQIEQSMKSRAAKQRGGNEVERIGQCIDMNSVSFGKLSADSFDPTAEQNTKLDSLACNDKHTVTLEVKKAQGIIPLVIKKTHKEKPLILETPFPNRTILREECLPKSFTSKLPQFSSAELELKFEGRLKSTKRTPRKHRELHGWALSPIKTTPCRSANSKPAEHISSVSSDTCISAKRKTNMFEELHFEKPTEHQVIVHQKANANGRGKQIKGRDADRRSVPPIYFKNVFDLSREKHQVSHKDETGGTDVNSSNIREHFAVKENSKELPTKEAHFQYSDATEPNKRHVQNGRRLRHKNKHMVCETRESMTGSTEKDMFIDVHGQMTCNPRDIKPQDPIVAQKHNLMASSRRDHLINGRGHQLLDNSHKETGNARKNQKSSKGNDHIGSKEASEDTQCVLNTSEQYEISSSRLNKIAGDMQTKTTTTLERSQHGLPKEDTKAAFPQSFATKKLHFPGQERHHKGERRNHIRSRNLNKCKQYGISEVKLVPEMKEASVLDAVGRYRDVEVILGNDIPYERFATSFVSGIHQQLNHTPVGEEDDNDPLKCEVQLVIDKIFGNEYDGKRQPIAKQFPMAAPHPHGIPGVTQCRDFKEEPIDDENGEAGTAELNTCSSHGRSKERQHLQPNADQNRRCNQSSRETSSRLLSRTTLGKASRETDIGDAHVKLDQLLGGALPRYNVEKKPQCIRKPNRCLGYFNASKSASDSFISVASPASHKPSKPSHTHTTDYNKQLHHHSATHLISKRSEVCRKSHVNVTLDKAQKDVAQSGEPFAVNASKNSWTFVRKFPVEVFTISKPDGYKLDKITKVNNTLANTTASPFYVGNIFKTLATNTIEPTGNQHSLKEQAHESVFTAIKALADGSSEKRDEKNREKLQMYRSKCVSGYVRADLTQTTKEDKAANRQVATVHHQTGVDKRKRRLYDVLLEKEKQSSVISDGCNSDKVEFKGCVLDQREEKSHNKKPGQTEKVRTKKMYRHLEKRMKPEKSAIQSQARGKAPAVESISSSARTTDDSRTLVTSSELPSLPESHDLLISSQKKDVDKRIRENTGSQHFDGYDGSLETTQDEHRHSPDHFDFHKAAKLSPSLMQKPSDSHSRSLKVASGLLTPDKVNQITQIVNNIINQRNLGPVVDQKALMKVPSVADLAVRNLPSEDKIEIADAILLCSLPTEVVSQKTEEIKSELASKLLIQVTSSDLNMSPALDKETKAESPMLADLPVSESSKHSDVCHQMTHDTSNASLRDSASNIIKDRHPCKYLQMSAINKVAYDPVQKSASVSLQESSVSKESITKSLNEKNDKVVTIEATVSDDSKSEEKKSSVSESKADSAALLYASNHDIKSGEEICSEDVPASHTQREFILKAPCSFYTQASNVSVTLDTSTKHGEKKKCVKLKVPKLGDVIVEADTDDDGPPKIVAENGYVHVSFGKGDAPARTEEARTLNDEALDKPAKEVEGVRSTTNAQDEPTPRIYLGACSNKCEKPIVSNSIIRPDRAGANNSKCQNETFTHRYQKSSEAPAKHKPYTSPNRDQQLNASSQYDELATQREVRAHNYSNPSRLAEKRSFHSVHSPQQKEAKDVEHIDIFSTHMPLAGIMSKSSNNAPSKATFRNPQMEHLGLKNYLKSLEGDLPKTPNAFFSSTFSNVHGSESRKLAFVEADDTPDNKLGMDLNNGTSPYERVPRYIAAHANNTDIGIAARKRIDTTDEKMLWDSSKTVKENDETNAETRPERTKLSLSDVVETRTHSFINEKSKLFETKAAYDRNNVFNYDIGKAHQTGSDVGKASQTGTGTLRSLVKDSGVERAPPREKRTDMTHLVDTDANLIQTKDFVGETPRRKESRVYPRDNGTNRMQMKDSGIERGQLREMPYLRDSSTERFQKTNLGVDRASFGDLVLDRPSLRETHMDRASFGDIVLGRPSLRETHMDRAFVKERSKEQPASIDSDSDRGYKATVLFERAYDRDAAVGKTRVRDSSAARTNTRDAYRSRVTGMQSSMTKPGLGDLALSSSPAKLLDAGQSSFQNISSTGQTGYHYSSMASPSAQPKYPLSIRVDTTPKLKLNVQQEVSAEPFTSSSVDSDMELKFPVKPPLDHRQVKNEFWKRPFAKSEFPSNLTRTSPKSRLPERYRIKQTSAESFGTESIRTKLAHKEISSNEAPKYYRPFSVKRHTSNGDELKTDFLGIRRRFFPSIPSPDKRARPTVIESSLSEDGSESDSQGMKGGVENMSRRVRARYNEKRRFSVESSGDSTTSDEDASNGEEQRSVPLSGKTSEDFFQKKQFSSDRPNDLFSSGFNDLRKSIKEKEQRVMSQLTGVVPKQHARKSLNRGGANQSVSNMRLASSADQSRHFFERAKDFLPMGDDTNVSAPLDRRYGRLVKGNEPRRTSRDFSDTELSSPEKFSRPYFERNTQLKPSSSELYDNAKRAPGVGSVKGEPERFIQRRESYATRVRQDSPLPLTEYSSEDLSPTTQSSQWRRKANQLRETALSDSDENMTSNSDRVSSDCSDTDLPHRLSATSLSPKLQNSSNAFCRPTRASQLEASSKNVRKSEPATEIFIKSTRTADRCDATSPSQSDRETQSPRRTPHSSLASSKSPRAGLYRVRFSDEVQQFNIPNVDVDCGKCATRAETLDSNCAPSVSTKPAQDHRDCYMNRKMDAPMADDNEYRECEDEVHSHLKPKPIEDVCDREQGYRPHGADSAVSRPQRVADGQKTDAYLHTKKHVHSGTKQGRQNSLYRMTDPNYSHSNTAEPGQGGQGHDWADSGYSTLSTPNELSGISEWDIAIQKKLAMRRDQLKKKIVSKHY